MYNVNSSGNSLSTSILAGKNSGGSPSPNLTGLSPIDSLITTLTQSIAQQGTLARKSLLQSRKALKQQRKLGKAELAFYQKQAAQMQVQPAPEVSSLSSAEVLQAQRQVSIDASRKKGLRKSIMAGDTGASPRFQGSGASAPILV